MSNKFSENLKKIRKDNNLSQEQLAEELGVSRQAISKWESAAAYPEMDKIIALCEKFHVNIDDLLHKDINEVKGEEESKKKLNEYVDDFLHFITNTIDMFSSMRFKSKCKCLLEQAAVAVILLLVGLIVGQVGGGLLSGFFGMLPDQLYYALWSVFRLIYAVFAIMSGVIIFVHIFKTRYLDYYEKIKSETLAEEVVEGLKEETKETETPIDKKNKFLLKKNEDKIVIRDPKHSEYRFINGFFKGIVGLIKIFALCFSVLLFAALVCLAFGMVVSFMIVKSGMFFVGLLTTLLACAVIDMVCILVILNFVFNRKSDKKKMIWSFVSGVIAVGLGCGFLFIGALHLEYVDYSAEYVMSGSIEFEMTEGLFFETYDEVEYVQADIDHVKIEYQISNYCEMDHSASDVSPVHLWAYNNDPIRFVKTFIDGVNHKKILSMDEKVISVKIYASKANIETLKSNKQQYYDLTSSADAMRSSYEEMIMELKLELGQYNDTVRKYEEEIMRLQALINAQEIDQEQ